MKPAPAEIVEDVIAHVTRMERLRRAERARYADVLHTRNVLRVERTRPVVAKRKPVGERIALALAAGLFGVIVGVGMVWLVDAAGAW